MNRLVLIFQSGPEKDMWVLEVARGLRRAKLIYLDKLEEDTVKLFEYTSVKKLREISVSLGRARTMNFALNAIV